MLLCFFFIVLFFVFVCFLFFVCLFFLGGGVFVVQFLGKENEARPVHLSGRLNLFNTKATETSVYIVEVSVKNANKDHWIENL